MVANLVKNDFYHLIEEFNTNVLDLLLRRIFPYYYWDSFEKFQESLTIKDNFYNTSTNCEVNDKKL